MDSFKKLWNSLKDLMNNKSKSKIMEYLIGVLIFGVVIIIAGGTLFSSEKSSSAKSTLPGNIIGSETQEVSKVLNQEDRTEIEKKLEEILSQIDGVGKVQVMVTYISGKELIPAIDTKKSENDTQEKDNGGGTRSIKQDNYESKIVYEESQGGNRKPIVLKELQPAVKGVLVVADGAAEATVRESLVRSVQVLLDVPVHKVQVVERKK